jgi:Zn-dependent protease
MLRSITVEPTFTIANPRGVPVRLQASSVLLPTWAACVGALTDAVPVRGALFMLLLMLLLYACGTLHELGHIWLARRFGARVTGVRISGMGAFVRIENETGISPRQDLLVALGGPVVSALLSLVLCWLVVATGGARPLAELPQALLIKDGASLLILLTAANVALTVFNLLPVFPMDGGRAISAGLAIFLAPARATRLVAVFGLVTAVAIVPITLLMTDNAFLRLSALLTAGFVCYVSARQTIRR